MKGTGKNNGLHLRVTLGPGFSIGPGKADLLEGIRETGSIAAAGRRMKMSYKRAWTLVEAMNAAFATPLVETSRGGQSRGGAALTSTGEAVLENYGRMLAATEQAVADDVVALKRMMAKPAGRP